MERGGGMMSGGEEAGGDEGASASCAANGSSSSSSAALLFTEAVLFIRCTLGLRAGVEEDAEPTLLAERFLRTLLVLALALTLGGLVDAASPPSFLRRA